ncbi:dihydrofolate reductase family protein [Gracilibacillus sp. YIM 98692]|uniref:dihydrofolate reductase family protein n=1 Tax=Gracilibacillus sp. YIM 98692 TaxID=2663532 RepID=UPI001969BA95|nr:dihydrofolate reductase family protein [Gracilibacillus sp. YIM 98692]
MVGMVTTHISVSLDGFVAGVNDSPDNPLGDRGDMLHQWVYQLESWRKQHHLQGGDRNLDSKIIEEQAKRTGAVVMGHRMFQHGEKFWGEHPPFHVPVFVVTHYFRESERKEGGTSYHFVTDGLQTAIEKARIEAGTLDVAIAGGADVIQQAIKEKLLDECQLHIAPVFLGDGVRLFEGIDEFESNWKPVDVKASPTVTHITYQIRREES